MVNKKIALLSIALCILAGCFGCQSRGKKTTIESAGDEEVSGEVTTQAYEDLDAYFDTITTDMLDACDTPVSDWDSYYNDPLILLNWLNEDIRLYGINTGGESAMVLYVRGEKVLIRYSFWNVQLSPPKVNVCDWDNDGEDEIIISRITLTGTEVHRDELLVCDYKDGWNIYDYDDYLQDIEQLVAYEYDEAAGTIHFLSKEDGTTLVDIILPDWTADYPYAGSVDFSNLIYLNVETKQMEITPAIMLENSMPYYPSTVLICDIGYENGEFEIKDCNIHIKNTES